MPEDLRPDRPCVRGHVKIVPCAGSAPRPASELKRENLQIATHTSGAARCDPHPQPLGIGIIVRRERSEPDQQRPASMSSPPRHAAPRASSISIDAGPRRRHLLLHATASSLADETRPRCVDPDRKQNRAVSPAASAVRGSLRRPLKNRSAPHAVPSSDSAHAAPGISVSSTIRAFSSLPQRRRRSIPRTFPSISA